MTQDKSDLQPRVSALDGLSALVEIIPDPFVRAFEIVEQTARLLNADICTLFARRGNELTLEDGIAIKGNNVIHVHRHDLDWTAPAPLGGLTGQIAITGKKLFIGSLEELRSHSAQFGGWDSTFYPQGIDHEQFGFGCLYGVPLRLAREGDSESVVVGVLKIERWRNQPRFDEGERHVFDLAAGDVEQMLRNHERVKVNILAVGKAFDRALEAMRQGGDQRNAIDSMEQVVNRLQNLKIRNPGVLTSMQLLPVAVSDRHPPVTGDIQEMVSGLRRGFASLPVAEDLKRTALENITQWLLDETFESYRPQLLWLISEAKWALLLDSFYRVIPFGTGGRRGPVGIGANRFNPITLASSIQGHVDYLRERYPGEHLSVVIAYDVREFRDLNRFYNAEEPNAPLIGSTSREFARLAAEVYTCNGVAVYVLPEISDRFISTPELSFSIRSLKATAGLNVSASHNHPDDNGAKFYNRFGGQEVPPNDEAMSKHVENVRYVRRLDIDRCNGTPLLSPIPNNLHDAYVKLNVQQSLCPQARQSRIVFTPLHGVGDSSVGDVLRAAGFEVHLVPAQSTLDGEFGAVPYRAPNPEVPESMHQGIELARDLDADLVLACDPDADRLGVCSRTNDQGIYRFMTGNEIACLLTHYKLEQLEKLGRLPRDPLVIKTEVTTNLLSPITRSFGGTCLADLLVGFKYHGHVLEQIERSGVYDGRSATLQDFVIAVEESHGFLVTPEIRDKDAAGAALLLAELAALLRKQDRTLADYLDDIFRRFGYYANQLRSMVMTGAEGLENIQKIQSEFRQNPPKAIAGFAVSEAIDHWNENGRHGKIKSDTDKASRNVLGFRLENGAVVYLRPSGTEPKNKMYIEAPSPPIGENTDSDSLKTLKAQTDGIACQIGDDLTREMLGLIGVTLPDYAMRISGLVPLAKRIEFVESVVPEFENRIDQLRAQSTTRIAVSRWLKKRLSSFGKDAEGLLGPALREYIHTERKRVAPRPKAAERLSRLEALEEIFFST